MTHQPLTKAERDQLRQRVADRSRISTHVDGCHLEPNHRDCAIVRLLDGLDAAEAERDAAQERVDLDIDEFHRILSEMDDLRVRIPMAPEGGRVLYDLVQGIVLRATNAGRQRVPLIAQRDRAEAERDALKAKLDASDSEWSDQIAAALCSTADKLGRTPAMIAGHVRREHEAHTACFGRLRKAVDERDALKAKLAALLDAADAFTSDDWNGASIRSLRAAIAAARGGAQ